MSFSSPYNFVPLSTHVHFPGEQKINQDSPLEKGVSGEIELEVTNLSPLIIGDEVLTGQTVQNFFRTPDGIPAIPGTSLKGYLRTLIEISTSSFISLQDNLFSERDLTSARNDYMTRLRGKKAGWLFWSEEKESWFIAPAKSGYKTIRHTSDVSHNSKNANTDVDEILAEVCSELPTPIHKIEEATERYESLHSTYPSRSKVGPALEILNEKYLVVTNQLEGCSKRREFLFGAPNFNKRLKVEPDVFRKFAYVMDESQTDVGSEHWGFMKPYATQGIPVFYLIEEGGIASFGLASLFRLPYDKSIYDLLPMQQKEKNNASQIDFATRLFGDVPIKSRSFVSRKGRVSVSLFKAKSGTHRFETVKLLLANPKPSYYPAYLEQQKGALKNYNQASQIRGFKQYLPHQTVKKSVFPKKKNGEENVDVSKHVEAISPNSIFAGKIRFHNLLPQELGALIWALTLGEFNPSDYVHLLGMGKPLGYGKCQIAIKNLNMANLGSSSGKSSSEYLKDFYAYLELEGLLSKLSMLKAAHREGITPDSQLNYLRLDPQNSVDEFLKVRQDKRSLAKLNDDLEKQQLNKIAQDVSSQVEILKSEVEKEAERERAEKQAQAKAEKEAKKAQEQQQRLQNRSPLEVLIEETFNNQIDKKAIETLETTPEHWQTLTLDDQALLANKIKVSDYYKNANKRLRQKIRGKLGELAKLIT